MGTDADQGLAALAEAWPRPSAQSHELGIRALIETRWRLGFQPEAEIFGVGMRTNPVLDSERYFVLPSITGGWFCRFGPLQPRAICPRMSARKLAQRFKTTLSQSIR